MIGSEPRKDGRPLTVLVYEYFTGGGSVGHPLPKSLSREGSAIREAIARDFASVPGVKVIMPIDSRLRFEEFPGVELRVCSQIKFFKPEDLIAEVDYTLLIVPETDGLHGLIVEDFERISGKLLGSSSRAVSMVTDKATMADHFRDHGIPTPRTKLIKHLLHPVSVDRDGPIVVKRRFGTGAESTRMIGDLQSLTIEELKRQKFILQPYLPGQPMSASFLVDVAGHLTLLAVGRQRIEIDPDGAISYQGGTILSEIDEAPAVVVEAVRSVIQTSDARFQGFVGVDYLDDPEIGINVLEINPRPTTSYVGLAYMFGPGMIAGAWLDSLKTFLGATDWPERFRALRQGFDVTFAADGTILSED